MKKPTGRIYQLKVVLNGSKPPIWRRVRVAAGTPLTDLHMVIQIAMGWTDSHLHQFIVGQKAYRDLDLDLEDDWSPEAGVAVSTLLKKEKQWLTYEYDFGDDWDHRVTLEKILPMDASRSLPVCIEGKRSCPPEDVGGIRGYAEFLEAYMDPSHPSHDEYVEWAGDDFQPERCDLAEINGLLLEAFG